MNIHPSLARLWHTLFHEMKGRSLELLDAKIQERVYVGILCVKKLKRRLFFACISPAQSNNSFNRRRDRFLHGCILR